MVGRLRIEASPQSLPTLALHARNVQQYRKACAAFDESYDRGAAEAKDDFAFPMSWDSSVCDLWRSLMAPPSQESKPPTNPGRFSRSLSPLVTSALRTGRSVLSGNHSVRNNQTEHKISSADASALAIDVGFR